MFFVFVLADMHLHLHLHLQKISHHGVSIHVDLLLLGVMLDPSSPNTLTIQVSAPLQLLRNLVVDVSYEKRLFKINYKFKHLLSLIHFQIIGMHV